jgi:hypothetical protein
VQKEDGHLERGGRFIVPDRPYGPALPCQSGIVSALPGNVIAFAAPGDDDCVTFDNALIRFGIGW